MSRRLNLVVRPPPLLRERLSVLIRFFFFSFFYIGDGQLSTTPSYFATKLYRSAVTL